VLHPDLLRVVYDRHQEFLSEVAMVRTADALPRAHASPRVALSRLLRKMADALDPCYSSVILATSQPSSTSIQS
jgi:hypothetical protein